MIELVKKIFFFSHDIDLQPLIYESDMVYDEQKEVNSSFIHYIHWFLVYPKFVLIFIPIYVYFRNWRVATIQILSEKDSCFLFRKPVFWIISRWVTIDDKSYPEMQLLSRDATINIYGSNYSRECHSVAIRMHMDCYISDKGIALFDWLVERHKPVWSCCPQFHSILSFNKRNLETLIYGRGIAIVEWKVLLRFKKFQMVNL